MLKATKTIGDWTEQRLAQFVQALPALQRRKDDGVASAAPITTPSGSVVSGGGGLPAGATADDGVWWDGFNWISGKVTNVRVAAGAAIAYSKLSLSASIVNADIATGAAIAYAKLALTGALLNADVAATAAIRTYKTKQQVSAVELLARTQVAAEDVVPYDVTVANRIFTLLPAATALTGKTITVKKVDASANTVTVDADGTELIDGATTYVLAAQWKYVTLVCDGTQWYVIANN